MVQLSLIRPKVLSGLIGQQKLAKAIRRHIKTKRIPKAWMFYGPKGFGKTTIARIVALSLQCSHQEKFGEPCKKCRNNYRRFPIYELNCADKTGIDDLRAFISGSDYALLGEGLRKTYILDEVHMLSKSGQTLLLKYLEDKDTDTVWILCSTEPHKIIGTLKRRCLCYKLETLTSDAIELLVKHFLKLGKSDLDSAELLEALSERGVNSPGLIAQAVEKFCAGNSPNDAADVEGGTEVNTKELCRNVIKGDLEGVWRLLASAPDSDARGLRAAVVGYLKAIMLETQEFNKRNDSLAKAVTKLCAISGAEDIIQMSALAAELYSICKLFSSYKR